MTTATHTAAAAAAAAVDNSAFVVAQRTLRERLAQIGAKECVDDDTWSQTAQQKRLKEQTAQVLTTLDERPLRLVAVYSTRPGFARGMDRTVAEMCALRDRIDSGADAAKRNDDMFAKLIVGATGVPDEQPPPSQCFQLLASNDFFVYYSLDDFVRYTLRWLSVQRFLSHAWPRLNDALVVLLDTPAYRQQFASEANGSVFDANFGTLATKWVASLRALITRHANGSAASQRRRDPSRGNADGEQKMSLREAAETFIQYNALYTTPCASALIPLLQGNDCTAFGLPISLVACFNDRNPLLSALVRLAPDVRYATVKHNYDTSDESKYRFIHVYSVASNTALALKQLLATVGSVMPPTIGADELRAMREEADRDAGAVPVAI